MALFRPKSFLNQKQGRPRKLYSINKEYPAIFLRNYYIEDETPGISIQYYYPVSRYNPRAKQLNIHTLLPCKTRNIVISKYYAKDLADTIYRLLSTTKEKLEKPEEVFKDWTFPANSRIIFPDNTEKITSDTVSCFLTLKKIPMKHKINVFFSLAIS